MNARRDVVAGQASQWIRRQRAWWLLFAAALAAPALGAQSVSDPEGYLAYSFPATERKNQGTYLSLPLQQAPALTDTVGEVGTDTFSAASGPWGSLDFAASPYYVRFHSGQQAGRVLRVKAVNLTEGTVTVDLGDGTKQQTPLNGAGFAVATGDAFDIIPGDTIGSVFGTEPDDLIFVGADKFSKADYIRVWNGEKSTWYLYYFSTKYGYWLRNGGGKANQNDAPLPPLTALEVVRRPNRAAVTFAFIGGPPTETGLIKNPGDKRRYTSLLYPVDLRLADLDFEGEWVQSDTASKADQLYLVDQATGKWKAYYQLLDDTWRQVGGTADMSNVVIPAGTPVSIKRRNKASGADSFLPLALPYTP